MDLASLPQTLQHLVHGDGGGKGTQGIQAIKGTHNQGLGERLASMVPQRLGLLVCLVSIKQWLLEVKLGHMWINDDLDDVKHPGPFGTGFECAVCILSLPCSEHIISRYEVERVFYHFAKKEQERRKLVQQFVHGRLL